MNCFELLFLGSLAAGEYIELAPRYIGNLIKYTDVPKNGRYFIYSFNNNSNLLV